MDLPPYKPHRLLRNAHFETIWPSLFRRVTPPRYQRERIATVDQDFLDLDWLRTDRRRLVIISHGLEGDSRRHYVVGMAKAMFSCNWDVLAWNFRGCSGEINCQPRFTHNGATADLDAVVRHALQQYHYETIVLVGFSMGGNLSLVYLGRDAGQVPEEVKCAITFSVPCDLAAASRRLAEPGNLIYMRRFLRLMGEKVKLQEQRFPDLFKCDDYHRLRSFADFDGRYTAPLHGFRDAEDYWQECSSSRYLHDIRVPSWIVNARNDPFLSSSCSPDLLCHGNPLVSTITPDHGGHCGFPVFSRDAPYWSELLSLSLLAKKFDSDL